FGKAGVVARGEDPASPARNAGSDQPQRPFGGDVQVIAAALVDSAAHGGYGRQRQPDLGIGWAGQGPERLRRQELDTYAHPDQFGRRPLQGPHDAVDLRMPGVGDDKDGCHAAAWARAAGAGTSSGLVWSAHRITSKVPS